MPNASDIPTKGQAGVGLERIDERVREQIIRQLLQHAGGWDRKTSGDPNGFSQRVAERMGVPQPITPEQLIRFMYGQRLDFDPGSTSRYSNFGYVVFGEIISRVTGQPYEQAVPRSRSARCTAGLRLDVPRGKGYIPGEWHRYGPKGRLCRRSPADHDGVGGLARPRPSTWSDSSSRSTAPGPASSSFPRCERP